MKLVAEHKNDDGLLAVMCHEDTAARMCFTFAARRTGETFETMLSDDGIHALCDRAVRLDADLLAEIVVDAPGELVIGPRDVSVTWTFRFLKGEKTIAVRLPKRAYEGEAPELTELRTKNAALTTRIVELEDAQRLLLAEFAEFKLRVGTLEFEHETAHNAARVGLWGQYRYNAPDATQSGFDKWFQAFEDAELTFEYAPTETLMELLTCRWATESLSEQVCNELDKRKAWTLNRLSTLITSHLTHFERVSSVANDQNALDTVLAAVGGGSIKYYTHRCVRVLHCAVSAAGLKFDEYTQCVNHITHYIAPAGKPAHSHTHNAYLGNELLVILKEAEYNARRAVA